MYPQQNPPTPSASQASGSGHGPARHQGQGWSQTPYPPPMPFFFPMFYPTAPTAVPPQVSQITVAASTARPNTTQPAAPNVQRSRAHLVNSYLASRTTTATPAAPASSTPTSRSAFIPRTLSAASSTQQPAASPSAGPQQAPRTMSTPPQTPRVLQATQNVTQCGTPPNADRPAGSQSPAHQDENSFPPVPANPPAIPAAAAPTATPSTPAARPTSMPIIAMQAAPTPAAQSSHSRGRRGRTPRRRSGTSSRAPNSAMASSTALATTTAQAAPAAAQSTLPEPQTPDSTASQATPPSLASQPTSQSAPSTRKRATHPLKRTARTVEFKRRVIAFRDSPQGRQMSWAQLARHFGVKSAKSVQRWCVKYRQQILSADDPKAKRQMESLLGRELELRLVRFIRDNVEHGFPVTGPIVCAQARKWFEEAQASLPEEDREGEDFVDDFLASDGWLTKFKRRHNLKEFVLHGERGKLSDEEVAQAQKELQDITDEYDLDDIFNVDESGINWRTLPTRTLGAKMMAGGKVNKDRYTVLCCTNATGTKKFPLLVIGTAQNPRVGPEKAVLWQSLDHDRHYRANASAWMTSAIWEEWLITFAKTCSEHNLRTKGEIGKTLLLADNAPVHTLPDDLKAILAEHGVRVHFLPPNMTSAVQPMDQGIIRSLKCKYRARMLPHILSIRERPRVAGMTDKKYQDHTNPFLQSNFGILEVCQFLVQAWEEVEATTIQRCWRKSGILPPAKVAQLEHANRESRTANQSDDLAAVGADLVAAAASATAVHEIEGQLVQGFRELVRELRLLEKHVKAGVRGSELVADNALAAEVVDWLRDGCTDLAKDMRKDLLDTAFVENSETVCWDVVTCEQMRAAFLKSLEADAEEDEVDDDVTPMEDELDERRQKEERLRQLLPQLQEAGGLLVALYGDKQVQKAYIQYNATLNG